MFYVLRAKNMGVTLCFADVNIKSVEPPHETPTELPSSSGDDGIASYSLPPVYESITFRGFEASKSAPHMGVRLCIAGYGMRSIEAYHETSTELDKSSGDGSIALRFIPPALLDAPDVKGVNRSVHSTQSLAGTAKRRPVPCFLYLGR